MARPLASMTGFGRATAHAADCAIACEIKSVNGRGLDLRMRLAPGFDALEAEMRRLLQQRVTRGSITVSLSVQRDAAATRIVVNQQALDSVLKTVDALAHRLKGVKKPSLDGILALKGVLDTTEPERDAATEEALSTAILACVAEAADGLVAARLREGAEIADVVSDRVSAIALLTETAEGHPARTRERIEARLREQVEALMETGAAFDPDRLRQEALLLATKADIREELDRLAAHVEAARDLLEQGGPVGRKLDFLAQEFNREANTLCSKSNDVGLTRIGLDLKAAIDQLREQVQNIE